MEEQPDKEMVVPKRTQEQQKRFGDMEEFSRMASLESSEGMILTTKVLRRDRTPRPKAPWDSPYSYPGPEVIQSAERYQNRRLKRPVFDSPQVGSDGRQRTPSPETRKRSRKEKILQRAKTE